MPRIGSDQGFVSGNTGGLFDDDGNAIVSSDTSFAASPLGVAARTQALYGIPNANFNITPLEPTEPIVDNSNPLPYWSANDLSDGVITATSVFDSTTQTYGVQINPGTAASGASYTLTTRSYLITDDNLALRQKALAVLSKSGTAAGTTQWYLTLDAVYRDGNDTALSTAVIGTVFDTGTWTSLAGTTTPGGSAINAAAQYVDLTFTLTTTAAVTGSAKPTIKSLLLTTSTPAAGGGFLIKETFTSSTTWNVPTGVGSLIAVVAVGAGGGGGGGSFANTTAGPNGSGGGGGGAAPWVLIRDLDLGTATSVSVGVGAGGTGGTAAGRGTASTNVLLNGGAASAGGATTFGSFISISGGGAGVAGSASTTTTMNATPGGSAGVYTRLYAEVSSTVGTAGGDGGAGDTATTFRNGGVGRSLGTPYYIYPYTTITAPATSSGAVTISGYNLPNANRAALAGTAGTSNSGTAGFGGSGGGGGGARQSGSGTASLLVGNGGNTGVSGSGGAGGASVASWVNSSQASTVYTTLAGNGGNAGANSGCGGGGGGALIMNATGSDGIKLGGTAGAGGNGADGFVTVVYIA